MRERFGKIYLSPVSSDQTVSQSCSRLFSSESFCFLLKDFQEFPVITIQRRHSFFSTCFILYCRCLKDNSRVWCGGEL